MSSFNYQDYQNVKAAAASSGDGTKIGFFKLKNNGDSAVVRFNCTSLAQLQFATIHQLGAQARYMKVSCLNEVGSYSDACPFCSANMAGDQRVGKASKKVYIQMLVSYRDDSGNLSAPVPVIWERPAGFTTELANKMNTYGNLSDSLFIVTRNGEAGNMQTTYSIDYAVPTIFKPELIPTDFSMFNNFKVNKHSYWEKSVEDMVAYLSTGDFPQYQAVSTAAPTVQTAATYATPVARAQPEVTFTANEVVTAPTQPIPTPTVQQQVQPTVQPNYEAATVRNEPQAAPQATTDRPVRNFSGFSF